MSQEYIGGEHAAATTPAKGETPNARPGHTNRSFVVCAAAILTAAVPPALFIQQLCSVLLLLQYVGPRWFRRFLGGIVLLKHDAKHNLLAGKQAQLTDD
jgi:hypothetical protein